MKKEHASIAKITRPKVKGIFPRKRLFDLLDDSRNHPVTWVSGPAGCGKTSLVASYLDERKLPCIWYQVDEGDSDIASFFYYIGLAAKKAAPGRRKPLPLLTPEYLLGIPTFTLRFFENLCGRLNPPQPPFKKGGTKGGFVFVFDNCHRVAAETPFHEAILTGMCAIPDGLNIILISRNEPPPVYARLQANCQMNLIGWDELRFTQQESRGVISFRAPEIRSKGMIQRLHEITDGWVAGLILVSEGVKRGVGLQSLEKSAPEEIVNYFGSELFSKAKKELQTFLMKTAFLPGMTAKMAQDLTGLPDSGILLATLTKNNYFIERRHHTEPVYQYHPLFRNFLISHAKESFSTEMISDLRLRAALLLEESGQLDEAASLFAEEKNWDDLTGLILRQARNLVAQGRSNTLEAWLNHFPQGKIESIPWLLYWKGVCRMPYSLVEARLNFERSFHLFEAQRDEAGTYLAWSAVVESVYYAWDDFTRLDQWIDWLNRRMQRHPSFPSPEIEGRAATSMVIALVWRRFHRSDVEKWLNRALELCQDSMDTNLLLQNYTSAMVYYVMMGETTKLNMTVEETKRIAQSSSATPLNLICSKFAEAVFLENLTEDPQLPIQAIFEGIEIANKHGVHAMDHMLFAHGAYGSLSLGDLTKAEEFLGKMAIVLDPQQRNIVSHYHFLSGWCQLLRGQISQADFHAEKAVKLAVETGALFPEIVCRLLRARVLHRKGKYEEALAQLSHVRSLIERHECWVFEYHLALMEAQFAMERGEEERCVETLRQGLAFGKKLGLKTMLFIWQPSVMARLCTIALEKGIEVDFVRELIRIFRLPSGNISLGIESWPWPLRIYTLGRFSIVKDGNPIRFSRKTQEKPLFMLKALIALGGREVKEEDLSDLLWPEADGDAAHHSFQMLLHRLRTLLGQLEALSFREGRLTLDRRHCWVDAWAFERIIGEADERQEQGQAERAAELIQEVIRMYSGPFLSGEEEQPWVMSMRERLRSKFLRNVNWLGRHWEKADKWEKVLECYQRGLEVDNLAEELYRRLMVCHQKLGQRAEALAVYNRCKKTLSSILEIEPSFETEAILKSIKSTKPLD
jgi:ATP/maltotriose-dependent transcriptional regulator MalT/DNA-binding SARP family transcriptional activator